MADSPFGWNLFYNSVKDDVKNNQDLLVCLVHFSLVSNGFQCIGLGESKVLNGDETKSENLPAGWRDDYAVRYVYQGVLYLLKGTNLDDAVMFNLIRTDERNVSLVQLNTRAVLKREGSLSEMIPEHATLMEIIKKQLMNKVIVSKKTKDGTSQTPQTTTQQGNYNNQPSPGNTNSSILIDDRRLGSFHVPSFNPVGRDDLNPFGADPLRVIRPNPPIGGGGMLFQPPGFGPPPMPSGMPPGAVPPGARFDPFRPPDIDRWEGPRRPRRPDNDEFPPPGYDDMFM